ncbi:MAG: hypothetical protein AAE977_06980 [Thermoplasmataceae archaeon]
MANLQVKSQSVEITCLFFVLYSISLDQHSGHALNDGRNTILGIISV